MQRSNQHWPPRGAWTRTNRNAWSGPPCSCPAADRRGDEQRFIFFSQLSNFARFLRRTLSTPGLRLTAAETAEVIDNLLSRLRLAGLVTVVHEARGPKTSTATRSPRRR